jgi:hypothetical protein
MAFWNKLFGGGTPAKKAKPTPKHDASWHQLSSTLVNPAFGELNVRRGSAGVEVRYTILMEPTGVDGWQTGVALDASGSMLYTYGKGVDPGPKGEVPRNLLSDLERRNLMYWYDSPTGKQPVFYMPAKEELIQQGYKVWSKNEVEPLARTVTAHLAKSLDADGGTTVIYWAAGDGKQLELVGDLSAEQCASAEFTGPKNVEFGSGTHLAPAVRYFAERFPDAAQGFYVFITDGELSDLDEVKRLTKQLCADVAGGRRKPLKCVLIGVGPGVDEKQMEELDDLETGTSVDIWDHKIAKDMRDLSEIFAEVVGEHQLVADAAKVYDSAGKVAHDFAKGLPARGWFALPAGSTFFELEVNGQRIKQPLG